MASTIYSTRFMQAHAVTALSFTVPAGRVAIVRDADCFYAGGVGQSGQLEGPAGGIFAYFPYVATINGVAVEWRGRQVFFEGETVTFAATAPLDIMVSGYLLTLP
jgi:hypothetical protein